MLNKSHVYAGCLGCLLWLAGSGPAVADHRWPTWGPAVAETAVNTPSSEGCPIETADGLSLIIASNRDGQLDLWAADRDTIRAPWQAPRKLEAPANSDSNDFCPFPVWGRALLFVSERADGTGCGVTGGDIYYTRQSPAGGWAEPVNLGCAPDGPNTPGPERSPSIVETWYGTFLFYSTNGGSGDNDIYVSRLGRDGFGPGHVVSSLSSEFEDFMPNVRPRERGGFEIVFNSNRPSWGPHAASAMGGQDVYTSTALFLTGHWSSPVNLGPNVNTSGNETRATMSGDGKRLHFGRDGDIYVSER
ncbi:MAG: hypothetical protein WB812_01530 [Woeseiaceae bacterium]